MSTTKTFFIEHTGAASDLELTVELGHPNDTAKRLTMSLIQALRYEARCSSLYSRYGSDQVGPEDPQVQQALVLAVKRASDPASAFSGEPHDKRVRAHFAALIDEDILDETAALQESERVFGDPEVIATELNRVCEELGIPPLGEDVAGWVRSLAEDAVHSVDGSRLDDVLNSMPPIRMVHALEDALDYDGLNNQVLFCTDSNLPRPCSVVPDDTFAGLLNAANLSADAYLKYVKGDFGIDLTDSSQCPHAPEWAALAEAVAARPGPPAITAGDLVEVLDNAYINCVPVFVADIPVRAWLEMAPGQDILVKGGQIGLHDFVNGSGHLVDARSPIHLSADPNRWHFEGNRVNRIYDLVSRAYTAEIYSPPKRTARLEDDSPSLGK